MACKRALVAAVLNATAASDIFTQDLEDMRDLEAEKAEAAKIDLPIHDARSPIVTRFFEANAKLEKLYGEGAYRAFLRNSKGESPTLIKIRGWGTARQLAWLEKATIAMEDEIRAERDHQREGVSEPESRASDKSH